MPPSRADIGHVGRQRNEMQQSAGGERTFFGHAFARHIHQMLCQGRARDLGVDRRTARRVIALPGAVESARERQTQFRVGRINHVRTNKKPPGNEPDGFDSGTGYVAASISGE